MGRCHWLSHFVSLFLCGVTVVPSFQRLTSLTFHRLQLDVFTLRHELSHFLPDATADVCKVLYVLLDETMNSAQERAPNVQPIDECAIADLYESSRAQRPATRAQEETSEDAATSSTGESKSGGAVSFYSAAAAAASSSTNEPTGALARLVLSSPNTAGSHATSAEQMTSPSTMLQHVHARNPSGAH
jgi:hypothetical protein